MDKSFKVAVILSAYDKMSTVINTAVDKAQKKLKKIRSTLGTIGIAGSIGGGAATAFFASTLHAAEENEIAVRRLEQVYRSMGQNVEEASKQSQAYASMLEMQIGVEDEAVMAVQAKLATFSKVSDATARMNGLMDRATAAAFDLGAAGFGEAAQNATILGKALQDPARGAMALARAGALNKGDLPIIKQIQATKGLAAAQEFTLRAVEKQVKGVAAATAPASAKMRVAWTEVTESIGKSLLPTVSKFTSYLASNVIPRVQSFIEQNPKLVKVLAAVSLALLAVGIASAALSAILMINPIVLIIMAIATAAYLIYDNWGAIKEWFANLWAKVTAIFHKAWEFIKNIFFKYTIVGRIIANWSRITAFFSNLWDNVKAIFINFYNWITGFPARMLHIGSDIINNIWAGMKQKWEAVKSWVSEKMNWFDNIAQYWDIGAKIRVQTREVIKVVEEQNGNATRNINQNRAAVINAAQVFSNSNSSNPKNALSPALSPVKSSNSVINYNPTINLSGSATPQDAQDFINATKPDFMKLMDQAQKRKERVSF